MASEPDSDTQSPPIRRFGPVTLLGTIGGLVMGLMGAVGAQATRSPLSARSILVTCIFVGVGLGVAAGIVVERQPGMPRWLRKIPWHWFRFNMRFVFCVMTGLALYFGVCVACARWFGLGPNQIAYSVLLGQLLQLPIVFVYLLAALAFINRRQVHPRVSTIALTGLAMMLLVTAFGPLLQMVWISMAMSGSRMGWYAYVIQGVQIVQNGVWVVGLVLVIAAALIDRQRGESASDEPQIPGR